jgi:hypothetical protein
MYRGHISGSIRGEIVGSFVGAGCSRNISRCSSGGRNPREPCLRLRALHRLVSRELSI